MEGSSVTAKNPTASSPPPDGGGKKKSNTVERERDRKALTPASRIKGKEKG
jgi:hypothetical protein